MRKWWQNCNFLWTKHRPGVGGRFTATWNSCCCSDLGRVQSHPSSDHWLKQLVVTPGPRSLASQGSLCWLTLPEGHLVGWWHQPLVWDLEKLVLYSQWGTDTDSAILKWRLALLIALHTLGNERRKSQNTVRLNISVMSSRRDSCSLAMVKSFRLLYRSCESELHMKRLHMVCWSTEDAQ